jgi:hypothetical protein
MSLSDVVRSPLRDMLSTGRRIATDMLMDPDSRLMDPDSRWRLVSVHHGHTYLSRFAVPYETSKLSKGGTNNDGCVHGS